MSTNSESSSSEYEVSCGKYLIEDSDELFSSDGMNKILADRELVDSLIGDRVKVSKKLEHGHNTMDNNTRELDVHSKDRPRQESCFRGGGDTLMVSDRTNGQSGLVICPSCSGSGHVTDEVGKLLKAKEHDIVQGIMRESALLQQIEYLNTSCSVFRNVASDKVTRTGIELLFKHSNCRLNVHEEEDEISGMEEEQVEVQNHNGYLEDKTDYSSRITSGPNQQVFIENYDEAQNDCIIDTDESSQHGSLEYCGGDHYQHGSVTKSIPLLLDVDVHVGQQEEKVDQKKFTKNQLAYYSEANNREMIPTSSIKITEELEKLMLHSYSTVVGFPKDQDKNEDQYSANGLGMKSDVDILTSIGFNTVIKGQLLNVLTRKGISVVKDISLSALNKFKGFPPQVAFKALKEMDSADLSLVTDKSKYLLELGLKYDSMV